MKKYLLMTLCVLGLTATAQAKLFNRTVLDNPAETATNNTAQADTFDTYMAGTKDLQADFVQTVYSKRGVSQSSGHMWLAKPDKFYWDYQKPDPQKIICDGKVVYQYDIGLEQISVRNRDELVGSVAVDLLNGQKKISADYRISLIAKSNAPARLRKFAGSGRIYRLMPKKPQNEYDSLWIVLDGNNIKAVMIDGGISQQTVISFSNMHRNGNIPAKQFRFVPPPGVDVVGNIRG